MADRVELSVLKRADRAIDTSRLSKLLIGLWSRAMDSSYKKVSEQVGEEVKPDPKGPTARRLTKLAAQQITAIEETTRARVAGYVERAVSEGMSPQQLAKLIREDPSGAFGRSRATTIARTETAMAYAHSSVGGWRDSGRVDKVIIFDGPDCGWGDHDDGDLANGSIRTLDEYEANPISHPRCVRSAAPALDL